MAKIDAFFKLMNDQGASDLHLVSGQQPALRLRGEIERVKYKELDNDDGQYHPHKEEEEEKRFDPHPLRKQEFPTIDGLREDGDDGLAFDLR